MIQEIVHGAGSQHEQRLVLGVFRWNLFHEAWSFRSPYNTRSYKG
jgi:hypothetical protein